MKTGNVKKELLTFGIAILIIIAVPLSINAWIKKVKWCAIYSNKSGQTFYTIICDIL